VTGRRYTTCANCDSPIDLEQWHPFELSEGDGDDTTIYTFCDDECKAEWEADD
jgi:hypothetical protein